MVIEQEERNLLKGGIDNQVADIKPSINEALPIDIRDGYPPP
jgi:hypothetical protein